MGVIGRVNIRSDARSPLARMLLGEATGALGDLGTFVPIVIALVVLVGMDAATILVFAGLANLVTGLVFRVPIAVQPMKAIAVLAIAGTLTAGQVSLAGMLVGICVMLLAAGGLIERLGRIIPPAVIAAIQLAVGAKLVLKGLDMGLFDRASGSLRPLLGPESLTVLAGAGALLMLSCKRWRLGALGLIALGAVVAAVKEPGLLTHWRVELWRPGLVSTGASDVGNIARGALVQVPLTLLNSVFAVSALAGKLCPNNARRVSPRRVAVSVGLMNMVACPFGAMPICHGSGGMAAQYAFGARGGLSMVILGAAKLLAGLLLGGVALAWMQAFPETVLSAFLVLAGLMLAHASGFWKSRICQVVAAVTVGVYFASSVVLDTGFLPAGFAVGWIVHAVWTRMKRRPHCDD